MGPHVVIPPTKPIEATLLGHEPGFRRAGRLRLQRPMHPLMATVLLRMGRFDQIREDPELHPPHRHRFLSSTIRISR
jgi:hypothetical protein